MLGSLNDCPPCATPVRVRRLISREAIAHVKESTLGVSDSSSVTGVREVHCAHSDGIHGMHADMS
jgi:hypothetical protein